VSKNSRISKRSSRVVPVKVGGGDTAIEEDPTGEHYISKINEEVDAEVNEDCGGFEHDAIPIPEVEEEGTGDEGSEDDDDSYAEDSEDVLEQIKDEVDSKIKELEERI
jgi:hypothetical protein